MAKPVKKFVKMVKMVKNENIWGIPQYTTTK